MSVNRGVILIVDDDMLNRVILSTNLKEQGYDSQMAENGQQALEMLHAQPFDLVLLDIIMPEMDGYQVLERMKADANLRDIPVIVISALDEMDSVVRCIAMGAEDYLPKPFDPLLLKARTGACMEKKFLRDQELEYLRNVALITHAAAAVEAGNFIDESLGVVAERVDALGQLARVFQRMAHEVVLREKRLKQQIEELRIEIDREKEAKQVQEITETEYFRQLQQKASKMRSARL